jgi:hypothetical protein
MKMQKMPLQFNKQRNPPVTMADAFCKIEPPQLMGVAHPSSWLDLPYLISSHA